MIEIETAPTLVSQTVYQVPRLDECVVQLRRLHPRLCPRQVLGARIGLEAGSLLGLDLPCSDKRLVVFVETDGCFADGLSVATGCSLGRRTLRLIDYGKVAATMVDSRTGRAFRLSPHPAARLRAWDYSPGAPSRWHAQLLGYQVMPVQDLLRVEEVELDMPLHVLVGRPGRVTCSACGEEILNGRGLKDIGGARCRGCVGDRYYRRA